MFKKSTNDLLDALRQAQEAVDFAKMAKCYFELGKAYKDTGNFKKTFYYLERFDNLAGGDDDLYEIFKNDDHKASVWLDELSDTYEPYEITIQNQVLDKSEDLNTLQIMQWLLLTMSRFCALFEQISQIPGYDFFGFEKLSDMVDYFAEGLYGAPDEEALDALDDFYDTFDEVFSSLIMSNYTLKVQLPNQPDFVPADLESGDIGTFYFGAAYSTLQTYISDKTAEDEDVRMALRFAACGILSDYYYRTTDTDIKDEPKIKEETSRIFDDYDFIKRIPDKDSFIRRIKAYKRIMLI